MKTNEGKRWEGGEELKMDKIEGHFQMEVGKQY